LTIALIQAHEYEFPTKVLPHEVLTVTFVQGMSTLYLSYHPGP